MWQVSSQSCFSMWATSHRYIHVDAAFRLVRHVNTGTGFLTGLGRGFWQQSDSQSGWFLTMTHTFRLKESIFFHKQHTRSFYILFLYLCSDIALLCFLFLMLSLIAVHCIVLLALNPSTVKYFAYHLQNFLRFCYYFCFISILNRGKPHCGCLWL